VVIFMEQTSSPSITSDEQAGKWIFVELLSIKQGY